MNKPQAANGAVAMPATWRQAIDRPLSLIDLASASQLPNPAISDNPKMMFSTTTTFIASIPNIRTIQALAYHKDAR